MTAPRKLQIILYQDVLCAWSSLVEARLAPLRAEFRQRVEWHCRPYPVRVEDAAPTISERTHYLRQLRLAALEPDGGWLKPDLWEQSDAPRSSVPALLALEAARLQGESARQRLLGTLRSLAFGLGVNVCRTDVLYEAAERIGLDMDAFSIACQSEALRRLILEEQRGASARGVSQVPTVVLGHRWMVTGLRSTEEYRRHLRSCLEKGGISGVGPSGPRH